MKNAVERCGAGCASGCEAGCVAGWRQGHAEEKSRAQMSVFFALITAIIFALFLVILESARTVGARLYAEVAVNSSIDSLFSQYHRKLWEDYRLMGLEYYTYEQLTDEMGDFMKPYLTAKNWYPLKIDEINLEEAISLTDENGETFEEDVLDYMRYGIVAAVWDEVRMNGYEEQVTEGNALDDISDLYEGHAEEAVDVEEALEALEAGIQASEDAVTAGVSMLNNESGGGFISEAHNAIDELEDLPDLVEDYEEKADALDKKLDVSKSRLDAKRDSGEISDEIWQAINDDITKYKDYVAEDGVRRQKIAYIPEQSKKNISFLNERIDQTNEILEALRNRSSDADEDDEHENPFSPVISAMGGYGHLEGGPECGVEDKKTEAKLEELKETFSAPDLLDLVLPKDHEPSKEDLGLDDLPSRTAIGKARKENRLGVIDTIYMAFYNNTFFNYFGRGEAGLSEQDKTKGSGGCEQEYIIYGHENDRENLSSAVKTLVVMRSGLNLAYLYLRDSAKKNQARALAATIAGVAALTPLVTVIQFLILSVWALAEAIVDVRNLLSGGKVPIMHSTGGGSGGTFVLSYDALLRIIGGGSLEDEMSKKDDKGLSYSDYLKILLFIGQGTDGSEMDYRAMDMIDLALSKGQKDFELNRVLYSLESDVNMKASHLFSELGFVKAFGGILKEYDISLTTSYSY